MTENSGGKRQMSRQELCGPKLVETSATELQEKQSEVGYYFKKFL